jgi:hypothetical protein
VLALVLLANDESGIEAAIASLAWVDACIAVDLGCTDATPEVCRRLGVCVVALEDIAREVARAASDWILLLEGHERVPADLAAEIRRTVEGTRDDAPSTYIIDREIRFLGRALHSRLGDASGSETGVVRLVRCGARTWDEATVLLERRAVGTERPGHLQHRLYARPYDTLHHFMTRVDVLATAGARAVCRRGAPVRWVDLALRPAAHLASRLPGASVRDGIVGVIFVVLEAYRLALVAAKRWELERRPPELAEPRG